MKDKVNFDLPVIVEDPGFRLIQFSIEKLDFRTEITNLLIEKGFIKKPVPLEDLHLHLPIELQEVDDYLLNKVITSFYDTNVTMRAMYLEMVQYLAKDILGFDVIFQDTLNIRFHFPVPLLDKYRAETGLYLGHHSDTMLGHPFEELNCWVPFTESNGSAALMLSDRDNGCSAMSQLSEEFDHDAEIYFKEGRNKFFEKLMADKEYYNLVVDHTQPVDMSYGELVMFDPRCLHGPMESVGNKTRVSMDFRLIPVHFYEKMTREYYAGRSGRKFGQGDVFYKDTAFNL
jgi:hypothetical protein